MIRNRLKILLTLCSLAVCTQVGAGEHHPEHHEEHKEGHQEEHQRERHPENRDTAGAGSGEAHVHGISELLVILEGVQLDIELHSPAMNLLGFEHRASSPEQLARLERVGDTLTDVERLFQLDSAGCRLIDHEVDFGSLVNTNATGDHHHNAEHNSDADPGDHASHSEAQTHNDIEARYRYQCQRPQQLDALSTRIASLFPGIRSLQVQWIVNGRQGAVTLDNNHQRIIFR